MNNCISGRQRANTDEFDLWINDLSLPGFVSDNNLFWNSTVQEPFKIIATRSTRRCGGTPGRDRARTCIRSKPTLQFANPGAADFTLIGRLAGDRAATSAVPN